MSPALTGRLSSTVPPGKPYHFLLYNSRAILCIKSYTHLRTLIYICVCSNCFYKQMIGALHTDLGEHSVHVCLAYSFSWLFNFPLSSYTIIYLTGILYSNRHLGWSNLMLQQIILRCLYLYIVHLAYMWVSTVGKRIVTSKGMCIFYFNIYCQLLSDLFLLNQLPEGSLCEVWPRAVAVASRDFSNDAGWDVWAFTLPH